jgi:prepilin signal peptidase PulO-like enzyme (type II secretory pathway)
MNQEDRKFMEYWEAYGESEKNSPKPLLMGFSSGLVFGVATLVSLFSGWDKRAGMVANSRLNMGLLLLIILAVAVFIAYFYRIYRWERNEEHYQALLAKKKRENKDTMQPPAAENGLT